MHNAYNIVLQKPPYWGGWWGYYGRMYDPVLRQMLSPDPVLQDPSNTQNYNKYAYVFNNPLKYTDPSGFIGTPMASGESMQQWSVRTIRDKYGNGLGSSGGRDGGGGMSESGVAVDGMPINSFQAKLFMAQKGVEVNTGDNSMTFYRATDANGNAVRFANEGEALAFAGLEKNKNTGEYGFYEKVDSEIKHNIDGSIDFANSEAVALKWRVIQSNTSNWGAGLASLNASGILRRTFPNFTTLLNNYPKPDKDNNPAHPSKDGYPNQCAIRMSSCLINSNVDMSSYENKATGRYVSSEGYARSAKLLATWLGEEFFSPVKMSQAIFQTEYWNKTGIIYIAPEAGSNIGHIDYFNQGQTGSGYHDGSEIWFWEIK